MFRSKTLNIAMLITVVVWSFWQAQIVTDTYRKIFFPVFACIGIYALLFTIFDIKHGNEK
jgi:hypothetical protein